MFKPIEFSIIIAARNEEFNLPKLFTSLEKLDYPKESYEIIFVNDQSTDNTKKSIDRFIKNNSNAKIYDSFGKTLPGKKGALDIGIKHAKNNYILITDADCQPKKDWLKLFAEKFYKGYDFIFGIAPYNMHNNIVNKVACFENFRSHFLTFTAANFGLPYSAAARSFGFKKKSFEELEGYNKTLDTVCGDDDLLLREAIKNKMKIGTIEDPKAFVYSETKSDLKDYLTQKARHTSTSNYYLLRHKILLGSWHLINLIFFFSPILMIFNKYFFIPFLIKLISDFVINVSQQKRFGYKFNLLESIYLQFIYEFLIIINYFTGSFIKTKWK